MFAICFYLKFAIWTMDIRIKIGYRRIVYFSIFVQSSTTWRPWNGVQGDGFGVCCGVKIVGLVNPTYFWLFRLRLNPVHWNANKPKNIGMMLRLLAKDEPYNHSTQMLVFSVSVKNVTFVQDVILSKYIAKTKKYRDDRIWTCDPCVPNAVHYQTVPHPDIYI